MIIGEIERSDSETIRITVEEYKGVKRLDIRIYYKDSEGELKPTKKGVPFKLEDIDKLSGLVSEAKNKIQN